MSQFGILMDAETVQIELHCAVQCLLLLCEEFDREIRAVERNGGRASSDYLQTLSDAVHCVSGSLHRTDEELKAAVEEEYERERREQNEKIQGKGQ